jgi:hypothetical protein
MQLVHSFDAGVGSCASRSGRSTVLSAQASAADILISTGIDADLASCLPCVSQVASHEDYARAKAHMSSGYCAA